MDADEAPVRHGDRGRAVRAVEQVRAGLRDAAAAHLSADAAGLLPGLVDGDTSRLPAPVVEDFRAAGLAHLTAVSGSNVTIVLGAVVGLARAARAPPRVVVALALVAALAFAALARPDPSVLRATAMGVLGVLAVAAGRRSAAWPALGAAVLVLVLADPLLAVAPGFALSVWATTGLLALGPGLRRVLLARGLPVLAADALAVALAAQLAVAPLLLALDLPTGPVAVPANVAAAPAVPVVTLLGLVAALVAPVHPGLAGGVAALAAPPLEWLLLVSRAATAASPLDLLTAALLLAVVVLAVSSRRAVRRRSGSGPEPTVTVRSWRRPGTVARAAAALALGLALALLVRGAGAGGGSWVGEGWVVVACDVGQGDALVLHAGDGVGVLVDAGPDGEAVDGCLRRLGVSRVPLAVVSHLHADHVDGLEAALHRRGPTTVLVGPLPPPARTDGLARVAAAGRGAVRAAVPGQRYEVGDVALAVLAPVEPLSGTEDDANNSSLVVRADVAGVRVLLPGDVESAAQRRLLRDGTDVRADVLKVPHHGSADVDDRFPAAVGASVALVSAGAGNPYGHPRASALATLRQAGARVARTDLAGDVAVLRGRPGPRGRPALVLRTSRAGQGPP